MSSPATGQAYSLVMTGTVGNLEEKFCPAVGVKK